MDRATHDYDAHGYDDGGPEGSAALPRPGDIVSSKYFLQALIGEGGMGIVYEALHLKLQRRVALKFLRPDVMAMPDAIARFEREARASARIEGPNVARVLDVDLSETGVPFMVMELLEGRDLEAELRIRKRLPVGEAVDYVLQACAALSQAHAVGVVHRDLKPSNLFLTGEGRRRVVKVLDFGISKISGDTPTGTTTLVTLGTPMYMSPEQVRCAKDLDGRTDVWSLAVILYELIVGAPPFLGTTTAAIAAIVADATPSIRQAVPDLPETLDLVLATALAKNPAERFPTIEAFAAAILPFAGNVSPLGFHPSADAFRAAEKSLSRTRARSRASGVPLLVPSPPLRIRSSRARGRRLLAFGGILTVLLGVVSAGTLAAARSRRPTISTSGSAETIPRPLPVAHPPTADDEGKPLLQAESRLPHRKPTHSGADRHEISPPSPAPSPLPTASESPRAPASEHPLYL